LVKGGQTTCLEAMNLILPGLGVILDVLNSMKDSGEVKKLVTDMLLD
tara:strand:+ start:639 stop:779 length:141 start_codon:yes stop_codon:yes gene_type:complete